jgi:hypothetical protein
MACHRGDPGDLTVILAAAAAPAALAGVLLGCWPPADRCRPRESDVSASATSQTAARSARSPFAAGSVFAPVAVS